MQPTASACTRRLADFAAGAGNSRAIRTTKNTARTRCATPCSDRGLPLAELTAGHRSGRSSPCLRAAGHEVRKQRFLPAPQHVPACTHQVYPSFNYMFGRVLTHVRRAVRAAQAHRRHRPARSGATLAAAHEDAQEQTPICTRRLADFVASAGNSRATCVSKNTARTRYATPPSDRGPLADLRRRSRWAPAFPDTLRATGHQVHEAALPTHPPARAACTHRVSTAFNYVYGRVLIRVWRAVRVAQPPNGMMPVRSCALSLVSVEMSRNKTPDVSFQPRTDRAALSRWAGSFRWWLGASSCAFEAMPRSCACSCLVWQRQEERCIRHLARAHHLSHQRARPAPSKPLARNPISSSIHPHTHLDPPEPLTPSARAKQRPEPARICVERGSLRHTQLKMRSRRTEPAAQYQPRPAGSVPPHPRSCLSMGEDL